MEICHIKEIKDFDLMDRLEDINHMTNLVALCRNCHWKMDKNRDPDIIHKVKIHVNCIEKLTKIG
jgi:hypothetical protein